MLFFNIIISIIKKSYLKGLGGIMPWFMGGGKPIFIPMFGGGPRGGNGGRPIIGGRFITGGAIPYGGGL